MGVHVRENVILLPCLRPAVARLHQSRNLTAVPTTEARRRAAGAGLGVSGYDAQVPVGEHNIEQPTVPDMDNDTDMLVWMEDNQRY